MNTPDTIPAPRWAILELMGHGRAAGIITKDTDYGTPMLRLDVPQHDGSFATQLINPQSIYRLSFVEEAIGRHAAESFRKAPVSEWEIRHLLPQRPTTDDDDDTPL